MFDWDDEVLENIIWGETGENEDHIVPYPDETFEKLHWSYGEHSKKWDQEAANVKLTEKLTSDSITDSLEGKVRSNTRYGSLNSLPELSPSNATKSDLEHIDEKAQVDNDSQNFDNQHEDKDVSNFVDYGWANVGSFDDLDRVLSNNDLTLWSTPKDGIGCPEKIDFLSLESPSLRLGALRSDREFIKDENQTNDSHGEKHAQTDRQRKSLRCQNQKMTDEKGEARRPQTSCGPWFSLRNQGKEFEGQYSQHSEISSSKHPAVPALRQFHSREEHQQVPFGSSYLSNKTSYVSMMPLSMTPQQKIKKLKRRQQMRAILAIRKQQQQFRHQVLDSDTIPMMIDKSTLEDTILHQLENVIARLGTQIRLCIRDSLFRLAQSSLQRHYGGDTSGTNKSSRDENVVTQEKLSSKKSTHAETKTNPIDRMVTHLLFHRPPESLESRSNAKVTCERTDTSMDFPLEFLNESHEDDQLSCLIGTENGPTSSCMDGSENASNSKMADGGVVETEASSRGAMFLSKDLQW